MLARRHEAMGRAPASAYSLNPLMDCNRCFADIDKIHVTLREEANAPDLLLLRERRKR